jgi:hypothetical protein
MAVKKNNPMKSNTRDLPHTQVKRPRILQVINIVNKIPHWATAIPTSLSKREQEGKG